MTDRHPVWVNDEAYKLLQDHCEKAKRSKVEVVSEILIKRLTGVPSSKEMQAVLDIIDQGSRAPGHFRFEKVFPGDARIAIDTRPYEEEE